jgi:hypothetical protein
MPTEILRPNGAGSETSIPLQYPDETYHWDKVDEAVADDNATFVYVDLVTNNKRDLYALPSHSVGSGTINKITVKARGCSSYSNGTAKLVVRTYSTAYESAEKTIIPYADWSDIEQEWATNPYTNAAWTWDEIDNNLEAGIWLHQVGSGSYAYARCTQVYVEVDYNPPVIVTPGTLALTLTTYAPVLKETITPGTLNLVLTTYAPALKETVTPSTLALTLTSYAPILKEVITPSTLALVLTPYAPIIIGQYRVEVDWNNDGDFTDTYDDITADVKTIHFSRGKSDELGKAEVGQLSITVNNSTGKYTPGAGGVISSSLLPKRPIRVTNANNNLFYGFIEEIIPHPHLTEQDCIITAVDGLDFLSRHDLGTALYKNALTGTIHGYILDDAGWSNTMRTLDAGQDTVPYWYGHDVKARFAQEEIDDSEQGFSYVDGAGYFRFEDRTHRSTATHQTSQGTFTNTMSNITYSLNPKNVYNITKVTVTPWTLITPAVELWRLQETPSIPIGGTYTCWGEASVSGTPVFVDAWTTLNSGATDYTASGTVTVAQTNFAQSIKIVVTNTDIVAVTITLLRARGTYYDDQTKVTRKGEDTTSQTAYQKRTLEIAGKYMTDADKAQNLCDYAIGKYKDPRAEITMSLINQDAATLTQILNREISDRITVVNTKLGVNADFFIDHMEHDISMSGKSHTVTYRLADCINEDFFCWDYSLWGISTKWGY